MTLAKTRPRAKTRSSARQPKQAETSTDAVKDNDHNETVAESQTQSPEEHPGDTHLSVDTTKTTKRPSQTQSQGRRNTSSAGTAPSSAATVVPKSANPNTGTEPKTSTTAAALSSRHNSATQQQTAPIQQQPLQTTGDLTLTQIISEYGERTDLLRLVLAAKTEQDRAKAEYERRLQEEMRFETRRLEFEMMLHDNYFKQQEQQQQQQQLVGPPHQHHPPIPPHAAGHIHRNDM
ncbi:hypothetical protein LPJ74_005892, partial [Coemansia sp. RSA 1843]